MANVKIEWLSDSHSCETCGTSYAEGARVYVDDVLALDLQPIAHCFGGDDYQQDVVFEHILRHFGHTLAVAQ